MNKSTCWYSNNLIDEMKILKNALPPLHESFHGQILFKQIKNVEILLKAKLTSLNILDIGCGLADLANYNFNYTGIDIQQNLDRLIKPANAKFFPIDIEPTTDLQIIKNYSCVVCNGFIDVVEYPLEILENILKNLSNFLILHRQEISEEKSTQIISMPSYGGMTYHTIINRKDLINLIEKYDCRILSEFQCGFDNWENGGTSLLIGKKYA